MSARYAVLVVAKAPVPGEAKTRLCPPVTPRQAADLAAASLLDTLDAVLALPDAAPVIALAGALDSAARRDEVGRALARCTVLPQRGEGFGARLAHAHADTVAALPGLPVVQIGMDTPQVTGRLLASVAHELVSADGVLGPAADGGWWALGLRDPARASVLDRVPMSRRDTAARTRAALEGSGLRLSEAPRLRDVDTIADAELVAAAAPDGRFAAALRAVSWQAVTR